MKRFLNTKVVNNFLLPSSREPLARNFLKAASILYFSREYFQRMFSEHYGEQDSIPVGCVPPAGQPYVLPWPPLDVSSGWGGVCPQVNKFEQVSSDDHQMSVAGEG